MPDEITIPDRQAWDRIDWKALYAYYISNESVTLSDVSIKFGVALQTIREKSAEEKWVDRKQEVFKAALALMDARTAEEIAKRNLEHAQTGRAIQGMIAKALSDDEKLEHPQLMPESFEDVYRGMKVAIEIEREAMGMDEKVVPRFEMTNPQGQKMVLTWGNGKMLQSYDERRRAAGLSASQDQSVPNPQPVQQAQVVSQPSAPINPTQELAKDV